MHTRRLAAFLMGAWLLGSGFMLFYSAKSLDVVSRTMANPPRQLVKEIEDLGPELTRQTLEYQATELGRFVRTGWEVMQVGIALAFLSTCLLTIHRSKFLLGGSAGMLLLTVIMAGYLTPRMTALGRSFDFSSAAAHPQERANYQNVALMYGVAETLKVLLGIAISGRLLFDRNTWERKAIPRRELRRKTRAAVKKVDPVDHADHGHVNG